MRRKNYERPKMDIFVWANVHSLLTISGGDGNVPPTPGGIIPPTPNEYD